jgi:RNA polymerase sigma factor (TIGR02999 family)
MLRERSSHTLQTTALIHEVYLRLVGARPIGWQNRTHFLAICARLMRRVLVDFARPRRYRNRGTAAPHLELNEALVVSSRPDPNLVVPDDALSHLAEVDARKSQVVELRFFGGLSVEETATALNVCRKTMMRDWKLAKAWRRREMNRDGQDGS